MVEREFNPKEVRIQCGKLEIVTHEFPAGGKHTSVYVDGHPIAFHSIRVHIIEGEKVFVAGVLKVDTDGQ